MANLGIITGSFPALSGVTLMARVRGAQGALITRASLSGIAWTITDVTTPATIATGSFVVADTVFDELVTNDPRWDQDGPSRPGPDGLWGYNFLGTLAGSHFAVTATTAVAVAAAPKRYQVDVVFTPVTGHAFRTLFSFVPLRVYG